MESVTDIKTWLISTYNIHVSDDWLSACVEFIQQETNGSMSSVEQLRSLVFEQWLCSDISEIGEPTLPAGISEAQKVDLVSSFPLQLLSIVDVGFPLYGQKQKLQRKDNPNANVSAEKSFQGAWEPKSSRMLMMKLTDGHQSIDAIEYKHIRAMHVNLPAGTKIVVTGPFLCRRGVMFLCEENVQVLGGEVDALIEANTPLSNLEAMMEKNRLDAGKASNKKFSGKFIARGGSDEKDCKKMKGFVKQENGSSWSKSSTSHLQHGERSFTSQKVKFETKMEHHSQHMKKEKTSFKQEDTDFQWEDDDIDYNALFDEAMDCMDDGSSATTTAKAPAPASMSNRLPFKKEEAWSYDKKSIYPQISPSSSALKSEYRISNIAPSSTTLSKVPPCGMEDACFDDDLEAFELDDFEDSFSSCIPKAPTIEPRSTVRKEGNRECDSIKNPKSSPYLRSQESVVSHTMVSSASSSPLSQLSNYLKTEQSNSISSNSQFGKNNNNSSQSILTEQKSILQPSKKETTSSFSSHSHSLSNSSNKRSLATSSLPKKAKQSKISDWGICKSNKNTNSSSSLASHEGNSLTFSSELSSCVRNNNIDNNFPKSIINTPFSSSGVGKSGGRLVGTDKDGINVNSLSTTSSSPEITPCGGQGSFITSPSVELTSPKLKDLPKAVIHPFTNHEKETSEELPSRPFQYLKDLCNYLPGETVIVKAYISTLTDKLRSAGGQAWMLSCRINDGTASLDVDLDSKVLTELIGFSAQDSISMRLKMKTDPSVKDVLIQGLTQCQNKLINISCLMKVVTSPPGSKSLVTQFIPVTSDHVHQLQGRVSSFQQ